MKYPSYFNRIIKEIKENPRKCSVCGCPESLDNIILEYKGGIFLCDDCLLEYDFDESEVR